MSTEMRKAPRRRYRKRRRAEQEDETRRRITEAAVDLHGSVGPARTTVSAVAERAGVQRATVYRHFPDEQALFTACSSHWLAQHPLPNPADWSEIEDPAERVETALREMYAWFERGEPMLERTTRDAALVPALQPSMEAIASWFALATDAVAAGRPERGARRRRARGAIGHALSFGTWRSLTREQRLPVDEAIALMLGLVATAAGRAS